MGILAISSDGQFALRSWQSVNIEAHGIVWVSGVDVIDVERATRLRTLRDDPESSTESFFSDRLMMIRPGTSEVLTCSFDGRKIRAWSFEDGQSCGVFPEHDFTTRSLVFEPSGNCAFLATDCGLWIYDAMHRKLSQTKYRGDALVISLDPNRNFIAVKQGRNTLVLLRREDFTPVAHYDSDGELGSLVFSSDGRLLFLGDDLERIHFLRIVG
jgi:WD40 repeat protein